MANDAADTARRKSSGFQSFQVEEPVVSFASSGGARPLASSFAGFPIELDSDGDRPALQTNAEATFNLLNNSLGVSILAAAFVCSKVGFGAGIMMYASSAYVNRYTLHLILRACQIAGTPVSYADVVKASLGSMGHGIVNFFMMCQFLCSCTAYIVTVASVLEHAFGSDNDTLGCCFSVMLLLPWTYIRSMKKIAVLSSVATAACLLQMFAIAVPAYMTYFSGDFVQCEGKKTPGPFRWLILDFSEFLVCAPMCLLSFAAQGSSPVILSSMADDSWDNIKRVTGGVYIVLVAIITVFGHSVYVVYTDCTQSSALDTIGTGAIDQVARWCSFTLVFISYIFMMCPLRNAFMAFFLGLDEVRQQASRATFSVVTTGLNLVLLVCAVTAQAMGGLGIVLRFSGGFCVTSLALIVPPILFAAVRSSRGWDVRVVAGSHGGLAMIMILGTGMWWLSNSKLVHDLLSS